MSDEYRSSDTDEAITISHELGEETSEEVPERIVALEWVYAENLLALEVEPVGVADIDGYESWVNIEPELADDVVDVESQA